MTFNEYQQIKKTIKYHMDRYYNDDAPEISDFEYDQMMQKLKNAERENPEWITADSPSQIIGGVAKREAGNKVTHNVPMLSIEDVFNKDDVIKWVEKVKQIHPDAAFSVETKIDGLSMTLRYERNEIAGCMELKMAETRGDGLVGENVLQNALTVNGIKRTLPIDNPYLELRGEVYMSHEDFERYNEEQEKAGKKTAANPRNLAAGTLRQLDASITAERGLSYFVFNVQDASAQLMDSHVNSLDYLEEKGVTCVYHKLCRTADEVVASIDEIGRMRGSLPYDIDGAVVKIDQIAYRNDFPAGAKYSSGHIAFKYPPEERPAEICDIEVTVGRTGKLGFIGHVMDYETQKPLRLCGTNVSKVTLHNQDYIDDMHIGIGGVYSIKKSGDVIPKLCGMIKEPKMIFKAPLYCPVCGEKLIREDDTADIRCCNVSCPAQLSRTISYFTSIECMNIVGLGETLIDTLVSKGYLKNYADIYYLKENREELVNNGIIGKEKNTDKILNEIEKSKSNDAAKLLCALGIRNVGKSTAQTIMSYFTDIDEIKTARIDDLTAIQDVGNTTAECIVEFFSNQNNLRILDRLKESGVNMKSAGNIHITNKLTGLTFVITGTLPTMGRAEAEQLISDNGGKCSGSISKKTSYLVAGEAAGSKLEKANALGIPIISEEKLLLMIQK